MDSNDLLRSRMHLTTRTTFTPQIPEDGWESILENNMPKVAPYAEFAKYSGDHLKTFGYLYGVYVLPTEELIDKLCDLIGEEENAIEICAGLGIIGRELNMVTTDSKIQENPSVVREYRKVGQNPVPYPSYIEKLEALEAVEKYKPDCVLACYGTPIYNPSTGEGFEYGVDYVKLLNLFNHLIVVSSRDLMRHSPIFKLPHYTYDVKGVYSRSGKQLKIYEWVKRSL